MSVRLGVGFLGAGAVVHAIHLPALARMPEDFIVRRVMDIDPAAARAAAERVGARATGSVAEVLADPSVDVVAVCTPPPLHAAHIVAACQAGVSVVLCEKPLATTLDEALAIAAAAASSRTHIVVGAMHLFDPAWVSARAAWGDAVSAVLIRSSIVLPPNDLAQSWATERAHAARGARDTSLGPVDAANLAARILGLSIHDLPLVRAFLPGWREARVVAAQGLHPSGYGLVVRSGAQLVQVVGSFRDYWRPEWEFEVVGRDRRLHIDFGPAWVQAGGGRATLSTPEGGTRVFADHPENGYLREWRHIAELGRGLRAAGISLREHLDDMRFATLIAQQAELLLGGRPRP